MVIHLLILFLMVVIKLILIYKHKPHILKQYL